MNYFAKNLKFLREQKKMDQQTLAEELKVPQSTLSCWETGVRTPKIEQIIDISNYFNVNMDIVSKDYSIQENDDDSYSELDNLLFSKAKSLTDEEKKAVLQVINAIHKDIDKELDN